MKTEKELRKEIDKILADKVSARIKEFQLARDGNFKEIMTLETNLATLEEKRAPFLEEKKSLNTLIDKDLARWNFLDRHIPWLEDQIKGCQNEIDKVVGKLTSVPEFDSKTLNFLSRLIDLKT